MYLYTPSRFYLFIYVCIYLFIIVFNLFTMSDLFHWSCLNELASRQPLYTAPAGHQCPTCQGPVFPPPNLASPVADMLREQLSSVNWARAGLGLPLVRKNMIIWFWYTYVRTIHTHTFLLYQYYFPYLS